MKALTLMLLALLLSVRAMAMDNTPDIATTEACKIIRNPLPESRRSPRTRNPSNSSDPWKSRLYPVLKLYRDIWQRLCNRDEAATLSLLFDFYPRVLAGLSAASNAPYSGVSEEFAEEWDYRQTATYLPFISAALKPGSTMLYEFNFDLKGFFTFGDKQGRMEDKAFGYVMNMVTGLDTEPMWSLSAGGHRKSCVKFGEYNWFAAFEILKKAKKYLTVAYRNPLAKIRGDMVHVFEVGARKDLCSCGDPEEAKVDFETLKVKAGTDPYYSDLVAIIKFAQLKMNDRDFHFGSYNGNSCSALGI